MIGNVLGSAAMAGLIIVVLFSLHHASQAKRENELDPQVILRRCR